MSTTESKTTSNIPYIRACVAGINAFTSSLQSCAIVSHFLSGPCVFTLAAVAKARSSFLRISDRAIRSHSTPCEAACTRRSSNLAADADSSLSSYDVQLASNTLNRIPMVLHATISISTKQNHAINIMRPQHKQKRFLSCQPRVSKTRQTYYTFVPASRPSMHSTARCEAAPLGANCRRLLSSSHLQRWPKPEAPPCESATGRYEATQHLVKRLVHGDLPIWQQTPTLPCRPTTSKWHTTL